MQEQSSVAVKRFSKQRQAIINNLCARKDHPSAEQIYLSLKEQYPKISLATVYRNLNELSQNGKILSFNVAGREHFDGDISEHYHFFCENCGEIYDINEDEIFRFKNRIAANLNCEVSEIHIMVKGKCNACCNK